jgi:hypothetical protein
MMSDGCLASLQHSDNDDMLLAVSQLHVVLLNNLEEELRDDNMMNNGCLA